MNRLPGRSTIIDDSIRFILTRNFEPCAAIGSAKETEQETRLVASADAGL